MNFNTITDNYNVSYNNITTYIQLLQNRDGDYTREIEDLIIQQRNLTLEYRNQVRINDFSTRFLVSTNPSIIQMNSYLNNDNVHGLLTAPTQVGKTQATINFIEIALLLQSIVIVTNDNHTDQQEQMYERMQTYFAGTDIVLLKVTDPKFREDWKNCLVNKQRCILFTLDNSSQINKLLDPFTRLVPFMNHINNIVLIHDEADTITKDTDTENEYAYQAESHKLWIECTTIITNFAQFSFKRLFVTATPANCIALYNISNVDIIKLEVPDTYSGFQDIEYFPIDDTLSIKYIIKQEVERIHANVTVNPVGEAIIISSDRLIANQSSMVQSFIDLPATVQTYNGSDMVVFTNNSDIKNKLKNIKIEKITTNKRGGVKTKTTTIKFTESNDLITLKGYNMPIADFYTLCKKYKEPVVITIGKDLITRAVSFVSRCKENQLCATTMVYIPTKSMHAVGNSQTIGRITGCVRKDLTRRLYTPQNVIDNYINTNKNQEQFMLETKKNISSNTIQTWNVFVPEYHTDIQMDRPKLQLGKTFGKGQDESNVPVTRSVDLLKIQRTINMWKRESNTSFSSKIFKLFINNETIMKNIIEQTLRDAGCINIPEFISQLSKVDSKCYHLIFHKDGDMYQLTSIAREFLNKSN